MIELNVKNNTEINDIVNFIVTAVPALEVYIFGSYANGTAREDSDYDFYVVVPDGLQPIETTWKIAGSIPREVKKRRNIDMLVGTRSKFNKYRNVYSIEREVAEKGVKLYG